MNREQEFEMLEAKIQQAKAENKSIKKYVLREIEMLKEALALTEKEALNNPKYEQIEVVEFRIRHYSLIRSLAKSINKPIKEYEDKIKEIQIEVVGEENWEQLYGNQFDDD